MFRALAEQYLDIGYASQNFAKTAWESGWEGVYSGNEVFVSNDRTKVEDEPKGQHQLAPAGGDHVVLPTAAAADMATDWCRGVIGVEAAPTVHRSLAEILRFGTLTDGEFMMVENLRAPLVVDGLDELLLIEGRSYGQPRQDSES